jgi:hypothetical protein
MNLLLCIVFHPPNRGQQAVVGGCAVLRSGPRSLAGGEGGNSWSLHDFCEEREEAWGLFVNCRGVGGGKQNSYVLVEGVRCWKGEEGKSLKRGGGQSTVKGRMAKHWKGEEGKALSPYTETIDLCFEPFFAKEIKRVIDWLREIKTTDQHCYKLLLIKQNKFF